ncbi:MAG: hypothetical protein ACLFNK_00845 [Candidatus Woesearchaeota archaeon]
MALENDVRKESLKRRLKRGAVNLTAAGLLGLGVLSFGSCSNPLGPSTGDDGGDNGGGDSYAGSEVIFQPNYDFSGVDASLYGLDEIVHNVYDDAESRYTAQYSADGSNIIEFSLDEEESEYASAEWYVDEELIAETSPGESVEYDADSPGKEELNVKIYDDDKSLLDEHDIELEFLNTPPKTPTDPSSIETPSESGDVDVLPGPGDDSVDINSTDGHTYHIASDSSGFLSIDPDTGLLSWEDAEKHDGSAEIYIRDNHGEESEKKTIDLDFQEYISSELSHDLNYDFGTEENPTDAHGTSLGSIYDVPDDEGLDAYFNGSVPTDVEDDLFTNHGTMDSSSNLRVVPHMGSSTYLELSVDVEGDHDSVEWYENGSKIGEGDIFEYNVDFFDETRDLEARVYLDGEEKAAHGFSVEALGNIQPGYPKAFGGDLDEEFNEIWVDEGDSAEYNLVMKDLNGNLDYLNTESRIDNEDFNTNYGENNCETIEGIDICVNSDIPDNQWNVTVDTEGAEYDDYTIDHTVYDKENKESETETVRIYLDDNN